MTQDDCRNKFILSFDISQSRTGWAILDYCHSVLRYGAIQSNGSKIGVTHKSFPQVLLDFKEKVSLVIEECTSEFGQIDAFVVEDLNMKFNQSAKVLLHYHGACKLAIAEVGYDVGCYMVNNQSVKGYMGVKTRKSLFSQKLKDVSKKLGITPVKVQMVALINRDYPEIGITYKTHDEADAIAQAKYQLAKGKK